MKTAVVDVEADASREALATLADAAFERGLVDDEYKEALLEREETYPTGLEIPTQGYGLAIPHANPEHVHEQALVLSLPESPVSFASMDDPTKTVDARLLLLLVVDEEEKYTDFLSNLVSMFQDDQVVRLVEERRGEDLVELIVDECVP